MTEKPLTLTRSQAAALCGLTPSGFDVWVRKGIVPGPIYGTKRWSRVQLERAAAGQSWVPEESSKAKDPWGDWEREQEESTESRVPHSFGNTDFDPGRPLGKREINVLLALHDKFNAAEDVPGAGVATIEKLGLRGYLVPKGYFYEMVLTKAGSKAAGRLVHQKR